MVCPRDGDGCHQTLHRNYLLPINSNIRQDEMDAPVAGVEITTLQLQCHLWTVCLLMQDHLGCSPWVQAGNTPQGSLDQPTPLRCSVQKTQNWLPWRYQNYSLLANISPSSIWDAWVGLCICFHVIFCLYTIFRKCAVWKNTLLVPSCVCQALLSFSIEANSV